MNPTSYKEKLRKQIQFYIIVIITIALVVFSGSFLLYKRMLNMNESERLASHIKQVYTDTYAFYETQLSELSNNKSIQDYLHIETDEKKVTQILYSINKDATIKADVVIVNALQEQIYTTFAPKINTNYFRFYNRIIVDKALYNKTDIVTGVYSFEQEYPSYVMGKQVYDEQQQYLGMILFYWNGEGLGSLISTSQYDGVITTTNGSVLASSNPSLVKRIYAFAPEINNNIYEINEQRYYATSQRMKEHDVIFYTFIGMNNVYDEIIMGTFIILILGAALLLLTKRFAIKIANTNAVCIEQILEGINIIKHGNLNYKIQLHTNDEFEMIAKQINSMMEEVMNLHQRNQELLDIRKTAEMRQLEAQFNPHFLYNTLETIRYAILLDGKTASDLIFQLTSILRYAINNEIKEVSLKEDIDYLQRFLKIQQYRFQDHFSYTLQIDQACENIIIPKLFIQPLVENSIKYGFMKKPKVEVDISIQHQKDHVVIKVCDNGSGIEIEELQRIKASFLDVHNETNHFGLYSICRRLYLQYGESSEMNIESSVGEGTTITLLIPLQEARYV